MKTPRQILRLILACCLALTAGTALPATGDNADGGTRKQLFDHHWRFAIGDNRAAAHPDFNDSNWRKVNLPHDWSIESGFDPQAPSGNDGGYVTAGTAWYRKTFSIPRSAEGKRFVLYFEGVYMNADVFVNGQAVGGHPYGYSSFYLDVTPHIQTGERTNVVAVRVDNSAQKNCRWFTGSGIYRHVWLLTLDPLHVKPWGVFVSTPHVNETQATVQTQVDVQNDSDQPRQLNVRIALSHNGQSVGTAVQPLQVAPHSTASTTVQIQVQQPSLWSPDTPALYTADISLEADGQVTDAVAQTFGIRSVHYNAESGLVLNGQPIELNGGCVHHDNGVLGARSFDAAEARKVRLLKEAGFNAVRTSHNVPAEAFLDECDRQGLLVIDEAFDGWRDAKTTHDYSTLFDQWWPRDIEAMVLRDRNHPSIFCWSVGNEVIERKKLEVLTTAHRLIAHVHSLDPTRPVTSALTTWDADWEIFDPLAALHDIVGYNYQLHRVEADHQRVPSRIVMQTESYPRDAFRNWQAVDRHPYVIGDFVWTAIDYLGESGIGRYFYQGQTEGEHYHRNQYPWHGAYCGDIDLTGWRKPISHYRQLLYDKTGKQDKRLYMAVREPDGYYGKIRETQWSVWPTWESWNWAGHEGKPIEVEVYSRYAKVRLYQNDRPVGELPTTEAQEFKAVFTVNYEPGELRAIGLDAQGKEQEFCVLRTAHSPKSIRLTADKTTLTADGQDLAFIVAEVVDKDGNVVPDADIALHFDLDGAGTLEATGNANLQDNTPYVDPVRHTWKGRAIAVVRSKRRMGKAVLTVSGDSLEPATLRIKVRN